MFPEACYVAKDDFELLILLLLPPECWRDSAYHYAQFSIFYINKNALGLVITAKLWNQSRYLPTDEWIKKCICTYIHIYGKREREVSSSQKAE